MENLATSPKVSLGDRARALAVSCLGLGYCPVASGTAGTLGGVAGVLLLRPWRDTLPFAWVLLGMSVAGLLLGLALGGWAERHFGGKDPGPFVLDEVVGYWVALQRFGQGFPGWRELLVAFLVFRLFDVLKPAPARRLERLPRGAGIMLDDVVAGIYANLLVTVLRQQLGWS